MGTYKRMHNLRWAHKYHNKSQEENNATTDTTAEEEAG